MPRILVVIGSPRKESVSASLAKAFLDATRKPDDEIDLLNVWEEELPTFSGLAAQSRYNVMMARPSSPEEQEAFDKVIGLVERLKAADKVVVATGMWNFSVPYRLKHWIDLVVQPGLTFGFDPTRGYHGLLTGRPLQLLLASGGDYTAAPMSQADFLTPYLREVFGFLGFEDIRVVTALCTVYPPEVSGPAIEAALKAATEAGERF
jgi:FMN-dependent NADH-azoreductase